MIELVRRTYRYRELIWALALKELKIRYKRSVLGFMWALLNPAFMMLVLTLVFSTIMRFAIPHYAIFLLSVLLPWTFFSQSLSYAVESIVTNGDLIKKVAVPKLVFPMAAVVSNIINLLLSLIPLALLVLVHASSVLLDVALPAGSAAGADDLYPGDDVLLRRGQCVLPGCVAHSAGGAVGMVLRHAHHLFARFHTRRSTAGFSS